MTKEELEKQKLKVEIESSFNDPVHGHENEEDGTPEDESGVKLGFTNEEEYRKNGTNYEHLAQLYPDIEAK